jgi:hypothetical protein
MYAGCLLIWVSKLQTEVALLMTEAECIALVQVVAKVNTAQYNQAHDTPFSSVPLGWRGDTITADNVEQSY